MRQPTLTELRQDVVDAAAKNDPWRHYTLTDYILLFFAFSFVGWLWELVLRVVQEHKLVNGGILYGPWLPIYGFVCLTALVIVRQLTEKPLGVFFWCSLFCAIIEYGTAWFLEWRLGLRWWDYSNFPLNVHGYICLPITALFGLGCMAVIYFFAPGLTDLFHRCSKRVRRLVAVLLVVLILLDFFYELWHPNIRTEIVKSIPKSMVSVLRQ